MKKTTTRTTNANRLESTVDFEEQISRRAYQLYERRGCEAGHDTENWLQAEAELASERAPPVVAETVKTSRKPPVTSTGKSKAKQVKQVEIIGAE